MRVVYEALDGKVFSDKEKCFDYEKRNNLDKLEKDIVILDRDLNFITYQEYGAEVYEKAYFIAFKSKEAAKMAYQTACNAGYFCPTSKGLFFYNEDSNDYEDLLEQLNKYHDLYCRFSKVVKKLNEGEGE